MSKTIGFRCPDDILLEIEQKQKETGQDRTSIIIEMIGGLPSMKVESRKTLPLIEAVYLVWTQSKLLYIGQTSNLQKRFVNHHRLVEFLNCNARIAWFDPSGIDRLEIESKLIEIFEPKLNGEKVVTERNKPLPVYLDELERETLETLASGWGVSMSAALKRLIRERREAMNQL